MDHENGTNKDVRVLELELFRQDSGFTEDMECVITRRQENCNMSLHAVYHMHS